MISFVLACAAVAVGVLLAALDRPAYDDDAPEAEEQPIAPVDGVPKGVA